jgi:hypothetical protein
MVDDRLRQRVDERRAQLKKALADAERDGASSEERAGLDSDLNKVEETLRKGWEHAAPEEVGQLHKWLDDTAVETSNKR